MDSENCTHAFEKFMNREDVQEEQEESKKDQNQEPENAIDMLIDFCNSVLANIAKSAILPPLEELKCNLYIAGEPEDEEPKTSKFFHDFFLDPDEYQSLAMQTCCINDNDKDKLMHGVLGLTSEAGEVAGIFQKVYQGHPDPVQDKEAKDNLVKECGDCLWMIAEILDAVHVSMSNCMTANINKLRDRYPEGFEADKSLHRKAGDI